MNSQDDFAQHFEPARTPMEMREAEPVVKPLRRPTEPRPCVALMGEFSAGKSTLSNLLLGSPALPVNVTAPHLPPVWLSQGNDAPYRVDLNEEEHPIDLDHLAEVSVEGTNHIRVFNASDRPSAFDLIDMPGISDPNMAADVWQRVIHNADIVIWCSHATQAWRQSEAAVWSTMPKELYERSILLLTRMDKILSDRDRMRVIKRVKSETKGLFRDVLPVSLIKAIDAAEGSPEWDECGATDLVSLLNDLVSEVAGGAPRPVHADQPASPDNPDAVSAPKAKPARIVMPTRVRPRPLQT